MPNERIVGALFDQLSNERHRQTGGKTLFPRTHVFLIKSLTVFNDHWLLQDIHLANVTINAGIIINTILIDIPCLRALIISDTEDSRSKRRKWTSGWRIIFARNVSRSNECPFCWLLFLFFPSYPSRNVVFWPFQQHSCKLWLFYLSFIFFKFKTFQVTISMIVHFRFSSRSWIILLC